MESTEPGVVRAIPPHAQRLTSPWWKWCEVRWERGMRVGFVGCGR